MKKYYTEPEISTMTLLSSDIITASGNIGLNTGDLDSVASVGTSIDIGAFEEF